MGVVDEGEDVDSVPVGPLDDGLVEIALLDEVTGVIGEGVGVVVLAMGGVRSDRSDVWPKAAPQAIAASAATIRTNTPATTLSTTAQRRSLLQGGN
jgi:hypothetical protein